MASEFKAQFLDIFTTKTAICGVYMGIWYTDVPRFQTKQHLHCASGRNQGFNSDSCWKTRVARSLSRPSLLSGCHRKHRARLAEAILHAGFLPSKKCGNGKKKLQIYELGMLLRKSSDDQRARGFTAKICDRGCLVQ